MTIQAPALKKRNITLQLVTPTRGGMQEKVGTSKTFELREGARFQYSFEVPPMLTADALDVRAWLHSLYGQERFCLLSLPAAATARTASTTTSANAAAGDRIITVASATAALVGNVFVVGDVSTDANFTQICRVVKVDGSDVHFEPALREAVASSSAVEFGETDARFRMISDAPAIPLRNSRSEPFALAFEEVV